MRAIRPYLLRNLHGFSGEPTYLVIYALWCLELAPTDGGLICIVTALALNSPDRNQRSLRTRQTKVLFGVATIAVILIILVGFSSLNRPQFRPVLNLARHPARRPPLSHKAGE
jgi:hypothetical protein